MQEKSNRAVWVKYLAAVLIGLVIALIICFIKGLFKVTDRSEIYRILCDAAFIPGAVLTGVGLLSFINKDGTFDGLGYSFSSMFRVLRNYKHDENAPKSYYEYKEKVKNKRKTAWHLVIVGLGYIAVAIVFMFLYK